MAEHGSFGTTTLKLIIIIMIYLQQLKIQAPTFYDKKLYIYLHAR